MSKRCQGIFCKAKAVSGSDYCENCTHAIISYLYPWLDLDEPEGMDITIVNHEACRNIDDD